MFDPTRPLLCSADSLYAVALAGRAPVYSCLWSAIAAAQSEGETIASNAEERVVRLYRSEGRSLVRLARLFVDDKNTAEDIVQEAFLRFVRHASRIEATECAPAYLRSIVLNLARDQNRRGLVSLRHHATAGREVDVEDTVGEQLVRSEEHRTVLDAVHRLFLESCSLPHCRPPA